SFPTRRSSDLSDVFRRGLDQEDEMISFMGRQITSVNQYKNTLGIVPRGWRVPLEFRGEREGKKVKKEILARLMGVQRKELPTPPMPMPMPPDIKSALQQPGVPPQT